MFATSNHRSGYPLLSDEEHQVAKELGAWRAWLPGGLHTRRMTFVIGQDRKIIAEIGSEKEMTCTPTRRSRSSASTRTPERHGRVRISAPSSVTRIVCSNWATQERSFVTTVQSSSHVS